MSNDFKLYDFKVYDRDKTPEEGYDDNPYIDNKLFTVQAFGINTEGKTASIKINGFKPFFYVSIPRVWTQTHANEFLYHLKNNYLGTRFKDSLILKECKIENSMKKLYGFHGNTTFKFLKIVFNNTRALHKCKNLWYYNTGVKDERKYDIKKLKEQGFQDDRYKNKNIYIYESNIPPLLRLFHIKEISPSGWVSLDNLVLHEDEPETYCDYEYHCKNYNDIISLPFKEDKVPYKIMSFDIEADSSHGDFPLPKKTYKKLATNIIDAITAVSGITEHIDSIKTFIEYSILYALKFDVPNNYGYIKTIERYIEYVYIKEVDININDILNKINDIYDEPISDIMKEAKDDNIKTQQIEESLHKLNDLHNQDEEDDTYDMTNIKSLIKKSVRKDTIIELLFKKTTNEIKIKELNQVLTTVLPAVEGDKITYIGSTFLNYGDNMPYLNTCYVLGRQGSCAPLENIENQDVRCFDTESELLLAWTKLVQDENPNIVIGYNISGFDWQYMFERANETNCLNKFMELSCNKDDVNFYKKIDYKTKQSSYILKETTLNIASGTHELKYIEMPGRLQIDLYNLFRREHNLTSYKLDSVAGHFIGDYVKNAKKMMVKKQDKKVTKIYTDNLIGLDVGASVKFEIISHSIDYYNKGAKYTVVSKHKDYFKVNGTVNLDEDKKNRWVLAKDDVSPQDIFRLARQGPTQRAIVAKYCVQDCNLVHQLLLKLDIITGFIEMSKLCSVPMSYLVYRGQGIKLTSYVAKKCREKKYLIKDIDKDDSEDGYEGAIVLPPKCDIYFEDPVACVDYSSLYPSSIISHNLCHSSKVSSTEYDLSGNIIHEKSSQCPEEYKNLKEYDYKTRTFDTYEYRRKTPKSAAEKVKVGYKECVFAFPTNKEKAVLPSVLEELLESRKATKKLIKKESDPFMQNVLDKRQLSIKLTANSLYGQCGAKTSHFYEPDVAASCTSVGRELLKFAKDEIEDKYKDKICDTKNHGQVKTNAEYIYGDTDSVFFCFYLKELDGTPIKNKKALEITIELAQQAGKMVTDQLPSPHDLEYEKTFMPFCLLSKKRYVGMLYEFDINKGKRKEMGIVLKRRDNAPIVKDVYGGVIDILMKERSVGKAVEFTIQILRQLLKGEISSDKLVISKSLRSQYKNPKQIAHKVLADRIGDREPGNCPRSGDRINYIYVENDDKKALQGDRIETPEYINENNLLIDYNHYITNQIMKPLLQLFSLVLSDIPYSSLIRQKDIEKLELSILEIQQNQDLKHDKKLEKIQKLKEDLVKKYIFNI